MEFTCTTTVSQTMFRNLEYFSQTSNLEKLRNVITTYVWENLDEGYMQVIFYGQFRSEQMRGGGVCKNVLNLQPPPSP